MNEKIKNIFAYPFWRQSVELGDGLRTPGFINATLWDSLQLPKNLNGKSFLDVGANDGLLSFEAEKRGASKIVASDLYKEGIDTMKNGWSLQGVSLLKEYLHSKVELHKEGIYQLDKMQQKFDVVLVNNVIVWLEDLDLAIDQLSKVTSGTLYLADGFLVDNKEPKRVNGKAGSMRYMYNLKYMTQALEKHGFKVDAITTYNNQKVFTKNFIELPQIKVKQGTKIYKVPEQASDYKISEKTLQGQVNMKHNGYLHLAEEGWFNEAEVTVEYFKPSKLYLLSSGLGMLTLYYRFLQYKHIQKNGNTAYIIKATKSN
ncbi:hypothetical protein CNR22_06950 [Sphingobacteriaceae bacterium]|nr:hypothetical protein CNR22_06950 [Sphingobacteriaceae bacterium]